MLSTDILVNRLFPSGAWECVYLPDYGDTVRRTYYGLTKKAALADFRAELRELGVR
jgi:hypothetical protein